ncbi:helix-turn-helix domain-containing protein [Actinomadura rugatobispora]|uniref:Helix-turn-helix domain-containing protein n=1 Tax=Actinomadura rugatobispora TaxID=1994 RepID=A0ABW1A3D3_9ACTN|nr:PucR family transcriptional regulator [Actinomadura rugatobispora]
MTRTLEPGGLVKLSAPLPRHLAAMMRPELPSLATEIIEEIRRSIPEYGRPIQGPYVQALQIGVERALAHFVEQIADPSLPRERHEDTYRRLGRFEAQEGRTLDNLQAAFRIGAQVAWRRVMRVGPQRNLSSAVMAQLADALFAYIDELASLALKGYLDALPAEELEEHRRRLLRLLLRRPAASRRAIEELAEPAEWDVPEEMTLVAVPPGSRVVRTALDRDVLADFTDPEPHLLVPGRMTADRQRMLAEALPEGRAVSGVSVPPGGCADSLRWARQALAMVDSGILDDGPVTRCEDHLITLWLLNDPALIDQIARRNLAGMAALNTGQRHRLLETLRTWLTTRGTAAEIAEELHVHPQTVRYRMRKLEGTLGERLTEPDSRFAIEVVLRAMWLRRRADADAPGLQDPAASRHDAEPDAEPLDAAPRAAGPRETGPRETGPRETGPRETGPREIAMTALDLGRGGRVPADGRVPAEGRGPLDGGLPMEARMRTR